MKRDLAISVGKIDISAAKRPTRGPVAGTSHPLSAAWEKRVPPAAQRRRFIRRKIYMAMRDTLVNPVRTEVTDAAAMTREIKELVLDRGADAVGVAEYDPRFTFEGAETVPHGFVIVFAMAMKYDAKGLLRLIRERNGEHLLGDPIIPPSDPGS